MNHTGDNFVVRRPGTRQPLYANAPPKPRRLNTSRDYSTSPDRSPERDERDPRTVIDKGGGNQQIYNHQSSSNNSELGSHQYHPTSVERRTPDAYGATAGVSRGDYEDVYGADSNENRVSRPNPSHCQNPRDSFASSRSNGTRLSDDFQLGDRCQSRVDYRETPRRYQYREDSLPRNFRDIEFNKRPPGPPRPHSADFLEYDRRYGSPERWARRRGSGGNIMGPGPEEMRPKSSVGLREMDHWSEENYAAKMRQSALYHSHMHGAGRSTHRYSPAGRGESPNSGQQSPSFPSNFIGKRVPPAGAATPDLYKPVKPNQQMIINQHHNSSPSSQYHHPVSHNSQKNHTSPSNPSNMFQNNSHMNQNHSHINNNNDQMPHNSPNTIVSGSGGSLRRGIDPRRAYQQEEDLAKQETPKSNGLQPSNSFLRSASARLNRQHLRDEMLNTSLPDDGSEGDNRKAQQVRI